MVHLSLGIMRGVVSDRESYSRPQYPAIDTRPCHFNPLKPSIQDMDRSSITCRNCSEYRRCAVHRTAVVCPDCVRCQLCLHHSWELTSLSGQLRASAVEVQTDALAEVACYGSSDDGEQYDSGKMGVAQSTPDIARSITFLKAALRSRWGSSFAKLSSLAELQQLSWKGASASCTCTSAEVPSTSSSLTLSV